MHLPTIPFLRKSLCLLAAPLLVPLSNVNAAQDIQPVDQTGTIHFIFHTDQAYANGMGQANYTQELVRLPGINHISRPTGLATHAAGERRQPHPAVCQRAH